MQLPTLKRACCPEARKVTKTEPCPRTLTPMFLLSDWKMGLKGVRLFVLSVHFHLLLLDLSSFRLSPPHASMCNLRK